MVVVINCPSCQLKLRVPEELSGRRVRCPRCQTMFLGSPDPEPLQPPPAAAAPEPEPSVPSAPPPPPAPEAAPPPPPSPSAPPIPTEAVFPSLKLSLDEEEAPTPTRATPQSVMVSTPLPDQEEPASAPPPPTPDKEARPSADGLRRCPHCDEQVRREATRCRFCGEHLEDEDEDDESRPWERRSSRRYVRRDCEPHRGNLVLILGIVSLVMIAVCAPLGLPFGIVAWVMGHKDLRKMNTGEMDPEGMSQTQAGRICGIVGTILDGLYLLGCLLYIGFIFTMAATASVSRPVAPPPPIPAPVPAAPAPGKLLLPVGAPRLGDYLPVRCR